jgi:hypothetical protein
MERFFEQDAKVARETAPNEVFERYGDDAGMELLGPPLTQSHR